MKWLGSVMFMKDIQLKKEKVDMDSISSTANEHKKIAKEAGAQFMTAVTIYMMFSVNGWDPITYISEYITQWIPNNFGQILVQVLAMFFTATEVYQWIYKRVEQKHYRIWKNNQKNLWVKGVWLHVHDKKKVRVGDVIIQQDFYTIGVTGHNVGVPQAFSLQEVEDSSLDYAKWEYQMAKIFNHASGDNHTLKGYYENGRARGQTKDGMHIFDNIEGNNPTYMEGRFGDVVIEGEQEVANSVGELYLYRLSKDCPYYSYIIDKKEQNVNYHQLVLLINEFKRARFEQVYGDIVTADFYQKIAHDPYLLKVVSVLKKYES